ncbi:MAG: hypothetical protein OK436_05185 [Thaumarchaeota archaeon]|nr:hypothetical protein [Nitrososphaerota archaeon]
MSEVREGEVNFNDRFIDSEVHGGCFLYRCMTCGAVVENTWVHEEWHQEIDREKLSVPENLDSSIKE